MSVSKWYKGPVTPPAKDTSPPLSLDEINAKFAECKHTEPDHRILHDRNDDTTYEVCHVCGVSRKLDTNQQAQSVKKGKGGKK